MRCVVIGCIEFSHDMLSTLLKERKDLEIVGVVTKVKSNFNSDFKSLAPLAEQHGIPVFKYENTVAEDLVGWLRDARPDIVFCVGWSHLLPNVILKIPRLGVIGYHPAALPRNRGRHPIIWTLALGLPEIGSSFFVMDEGADSGNLVSQRILPVGENDDAAAVYAKVTAAARMQIVEMVDQATNGTLKAVPQDHRLSNSWRKRSAKDGEIDWRMSARSVHNLVRALAHPYPGAHCVSGGAEVKIWKTAVVKDSPLHLEPGKVLQIENGTLRIKCGEGSLDLLQHEFKTLPKVGDYL